jgi:hypothetical protein
MGAPAAGPRQITTLRNNFSASKLRSMLMQANIKTSEIILQFILLKTSYKIENPTSFSA